MATPLTLEMVAAIMPNAISNGLRDEFGYLLETCRHFEINTRNRVAAFLMNVAKESGELYYVEEIADGWDYEWRSDLGNVYEGDGPRFKGRGYIQVTGRINYQALSDALGVDFVFFPHRVEEVKNAWLSAGWYWRYGSSSGNLNRIADSGDYQRTILGVRGSPDPDRERYWWAAMDVLPDDLGIPAASDNNGGSGMVKAIDLVEACKLLRGVFYRTWYLGDSLPMWVDDGYAAREFPPVKHMGNVGVMCADLINWGLVYCGGDWVGGTSAFYDAVMDAEYFDSAEPGELGAIAGSPYIADDLANQGHVLLYTGAHSTIQALYSDGVTEKYTDQETAGFLNLTYYGKVPGVDYSQGDSVDPSPFITAPRWVAINKDGILVANGMDYSGGWYDTNYDRKDNSWRGPKES